MFDRRFFSCLDWMLLVAIGVLCLIGLVMIFSATYDPVTDEVGPQFYRQILGLLLGFIALVVCLVVDYRVLVERSLLLYVGLVALLFYTLVFGVEQGGSQRWIGLGGINLQPSEFFQGGGCTCFGVFLFSRSTGGASSGRLVDRCGVCWSTVCFDCKGARSWYGCQPASGLRRDDGVCWIETPDTRDDHAAWGTRGSGRVGLWT